MYTIFLVDTFDASYITFLLKIYQYINLCLYIQYLPRIQYFPRNIDNLDNPKTGKELFGEYGSKFYISKHVKGTHGEI